MLFSYTISNFKSIKLPESINFKSKPYKGTINTLDNKLLSMIGIYGPNGGGKSSIFESMSMLLDILKLNNNISLLNQYFKSFELYKNKNNISMPIKWEVIILSKTKIFYKYKISLNNSEIEEESLEMYENENSKKTELIFLKKMQEYKLGKSFKNIKLKNIGFGSLLSYLNTNIENQYVTEFFNEMMKINIIKNVYNAPVGINTITATLIYNLDFDVIEKEKNKILNILADLDINIIDYKIVKDQIGQNRLILTKKNDISTYELDFLQESDGTKKIIQLISYFIKGIHNGYIFFIDEIDSQLHTKLLGYILELFHSNFNKSSQLIFSSHDMNTLDSKYLRKDEIYFAGLNESYFTNLICLSNFKEVREKSSFSKKYLNGDFGYDPYILKAKGWNNE